MNENNCLKILFYEWEKDEIPFYLWRLIRFHSHDKYNFLKK